MVCVRGSMNSVEMLNLFERQLSLLIKTHQDGQRESLRELSEFQQTLEAFDESALGEAEREVVVDIKKMFATSITKLTAQFSDDLEFLIEQKDAIDAVNGVQDEEKRKELIAMLVEDFGEVETDFEVFEKDLQAQAAEDRQFLQNIIQDLTHMLQEGGFKEIEAVLSEFTDMSEDDEEDEALLPDGDLSDEDLEAVKEAFQKINRPYLDQNDDEDDQELN